MKEAMKSEMKSAQQRRVSHAIGSRNAVVGGDWASATPWSNDKGQLEATMNTTEISCEVRSVATPSKSTTRYFFILTCHVPSEYYPGTAVFCR